MVTLTQLRTQWEQAQSNKNACATVICDYLLQGWHHLANILLPEYERLRTAEKETYDVYTKAVIEYERQSKK